MEQNEYLYLGIGAIAIAALLGLSAVVANYELSANSAESFNAQVSIKTENQSYYADVPKEKLFSDADNEVVLFSSVENESKLRCNISCDKNN